MAGNTGANTHEYFSFEIPHLATQHSTAKAGTVRPANERTPLERKDPGKKPKVLDLAVYLDEDVDFPPSPTRSTKKGPILLGSDILSNLLKIPVLSAPPASVSPTLSPSTYMSHDNVPHTPTAPSSGTTPLPPVTDGEASGQSPQDPNHPPHATPPNRLPTNIRSRFIEPVGPDWPTIYGQTLERIMHPITPAHQRNWKTLDGDKILAAISRLKVTRNAADRVAAMTALERLLQTAFPENVEIDIILGDTIQEHVRPSSAYPFLVQGLSDEEIRILKNESVLANEDVAVFFYPYDTALPMTDYAVSLEGLVLTPSIQDDARAAAELIRFLSGLSEITHFIAQHNDNIPFNEVPNPHNFVHWTLNTLRVTSSMVKRCNSGPTPVHNIFINPPTTEPGAYKKWITLLHGLHFDTRKGTGKPTIAELCNVCKSVAHNEDTCPYAAIPGWPTTPPSDKPTHSIPHGGAPPCGRGRGGNFGRGRDDSPPRGPLVSAHGSLVNRGVAGLTAVSISNDIDRVTESSPVLTSPICGDAPRSHPVRVAGQSGEIHHNNNATVQPLQLNCAQNSQSMSNENNNITRDNTYFIHPLLYNDPHRTPSSDNEPPHPVNQNDSNRSITNDAITASLTQGDTTRPHPTQVTRHLRENQQSNNTTHHNVQPTVRNSPHPTANRSSSESRSDSARSRIESHPPPTESDDSSELSSYEASNTDSRSMSFSDNDDPWPDPPDPQSQHSPLKSPRKKHCGELRITSQNM
ncbi:hypothetical protein M422DRAFT_256486 [Sphaerobolus stellatus SS14]|uniref:Uncharacterized protein n=1 Tax=Sphaerobolus stellatus (strain SS14) TaxID=990650 RepID=A0A0C9VQL4_SPHS4|nr:hypothetical protein M422DRAFT_256486 [Sphaerobolus stellatus SS14]